MNKEHTEYLAKTYPKIYCDLNKPAEESCMHWGFACGDGWFKILDKLSRNLQCWVDNPDWVHRDPAWLRVVKRVATDICWNPLTYRFFSWLYLRNIPRSHSCNDPMAPTYQAQWKKYYKWQDGLRFQSLYRKPDFDPKRQIVALQVKEKFGTLCFYYFGGDRYIAGLVSMAESMSAVTCETCGCTDDTVGQNTKGWIQTLCLKCRSARNANKTN